MSTKQVSVSKLDSDQVKHKFSLLIKAAHGIKDQEMAESFFEKEKFFFLKLMEETPKLKETTELSQIATFLDVVTNGLTFEKIAHHVYVMARNTKVGDSYELRMCFEIAKNGTLHLVKKAGFVDSVTNPVIVYEGDKIEVETINGILNIKHTPAIPRKSQTILGGFCFIVNDGNREAFWYPIERVDRLAKFSAKQNKKWDKAKNAYVEGSANELYSSGPNGQIDEGFFATKLVKAAIKNYSTKPLVNSDNNVDDGTYIPENVSDETRYLNTLDSAPGSEATEVASTKNEEELIPEAF